MSCALALLAASSASAADTRYAAPGATNTGPACPQTDPCTIRAAIEGAPVADGDTVLLEPGDYDLAGGWPLVIGESIEVRPAQPGTRPRVLNDGEIVFHLESGATLTGLHVESRDLSSAVGVIFMQNTAELLRLDRMVVVSPSLPNEAAVVNRSGGIELTNSAVFVEGDGAIALQLDAATDSLDSVIRNSTLIAEGPDSTGIWAYSGALFQDVGVTNTIARGEGFGIRAVDSTGAAALHLNLDHSNVNSISDPEDDDPEVIEGAGNQSQPPLLANPAAGDFAELEGSPTIDAGLDEGLSGPFDLLGGPRVLGATIDIGADEYPSPPVVSDTLAPETTIAKGPKRKQKTKRKRAKAKFVFASSEPGSSFECALDGATFRPCSAPHRVKVKAQRRVKRHEMLVRATDAAGNVDQTPAAHRWKLKRKR